MPDDRPSNPATHAATAAMPGPAAFGRYVRQLSLAVVGGLLAAALVNLFVDPYGVWRVTSIEGLNAAKTERRDQNYMFRAVDLARLEPRAILFGSSRAALGLRPDHPSFARFDGRVYNAAMTGGHLHALRRYLEHAVHASPELEHVTLGVDFYAFGSNFSLHRTFDDGRLDRRGIGPKDAFQTLFSLDALVDSWGTVRGNRSNPDAVPYEEDGQMTAVELARDVGRRGMARRMDRSLRHYLNSSSRYGGYEPYEAAWEEFARILEIVEANDLELRVFVSPVHAVLLEGIRLRGYGPQYEAWLARLAEHVEFVDFGGPNGVTAEPIDDAMTNYWDVSHYREEVGDLVLARLAGEEVTVEGEPFGVAVDRDSVARRIETVREATARWRTAHPEFTEFARERMEPR